MVQMVLSPSPDPQQLLIKAKPKPGDALENAFTAGADVGLLGIELATRRRNRANGRVAARLFDGIAFHVEQSFGNCPQYIREREWRRVDVQSNPKSRRSLELSSAQQHWIANADTFFIASGFREDGESSTYGMDVSHRGGEPGFVRVVSATTLQFPDYAGNNHYNTIGNLVLDPRAGLLFIDFTTGGLLQLSGKTSIDWDSQEIAQYPGARRLVTLNIDAVVELQSATALRWDANADSIRSLRLIDKIIESNDVTSFIFEARDGGPLPTFKAGQHLPIEITVADRADVVRRTYSLSNAPNDAHYRISVKREALGLCSRYLHDEISPGAIIDTRRPAGDFIMTCNDCPIVLISAGVGVTPMMSMLHQLVAENSERPVWFIYGTRDGRFHPFKQEIRALIASRSNVKTHITYSRPRAEDQRDRDYDGEGRVTGSLIANLVNASGAHYYLCGPNQFLADIQSTLEQLAVPAEHIHYETFGPIT